MLHLKTLQKVTASDSGRGETFGPMLIGYTIMLFFALVQTVVYLRRSTGDSIRIKSAVIALWIVDNIHAVIAIVGMYTYLVKLHGNEHGIGLTSWAIGVGQCLSQCAEGSSRIMLPGTSLYDPFTHTESGDQYKPHVACPNSAHLDERVQVFLSALMLVMLDRLAAMGLSVFTSKTIHPIHDKVSSLSVYGVALAGGMSWTESRAVNASIALLVMWCGYVGDACEIVADAVIAFIITHLLLRLRSGLPDINTGLLTCFLVMASLVLLITAPHSSAGLAIYIVLSKLYINALLGTLNARQRSEIARSEDAVPVLTTHIVLAPGTDGMAPENNPDTSAVERSRRLEVPATLVRHSREQMHSTLEIDKLTFDLLMKAFTKGHSMRWIEANSRYCCSAKCDSVSLSKDPPALRIVVMAFLQPVTTHKKTELGRALPANSNLMLNYRLDRNST
ncbi:hypothetical protein OBBRIDRAFT_808659 [Obba rivulosa]|uniref:DUF6534 domain-containing protein n=1 Tax=Obba rivulosa TaxID=1052685 RepID=A0A8E2DDM4_9APHY|nr:hypothetical protein OBBRIDRAFT_808659 [Obba rivulosa]